MESREKLLKAAADLASEEGIKGLTQPRVAKRAGVRQSLLTYYFPKRSDLMEALLQRFIEAADKRLAQLSSTESVPDLLHSLYQLVSDRERMRFFVSMLIEADRDPELRQTMIAHLHSFEAVVAQHLGVAPDDPTVIQTVGTLRGMALRRLIIDDPPSVERIWSSI